ncbi:hypothetical protein H8356DRAFT_1429195 [Neocallimastix lanati (nom. inval.)]|nr:hypothetical protein H8356DRAFT_1429195 [Neocallimastix sp. JGI-2020a]
MEKSIPNVSYEKLIHDYILKQKRFKYDVKQIQKSIISCDYKKKGYSLNEYVKKKWNISQKEAYRFLIAAKVMDTLDEFEIQPNYINLCKSLYNYAKTSDQLKLLWKTLLKEANGKPYCINSSHVSKTWKELCNNKKYSNICHYEDTIIKKLGTSLLNSKSNNNNNINSSSSSGSSSGSGSGSSSSGSGSGSSGSGSNNNNNNNNKNKNLKTLHKEENGNPYGNNNSHVSKTWKEFYNDKKYSNVCHYEDNIIKNFGISSPDLKINTKINNNNNIIINSNSISSSNNNDNSYKNSISNNNTNNIYQIQNASLPLPTTKSVILSTNQVTPLPLTTISHISSPSNQTIHFPSYPIPQTQSYPPTTISSLIPSIAMPISSTSIPVITSTNPLHISPTLNEINGASSNNYYPNQIISSNNPIIILYYKESPIKNSIYHPYQNYHL